MNKYSNLHHEFKKTEKNPIFTIFYQGIFLRITNTFKNSFSAATYNFLLYVSIMFALLVLKDS